MTNYLKEPDGYLSLETSTASKPYIISHAANISVHIVVNNDSAAAGKIQVQVSNIVNDDAAYWVPVYSYDSTDTKQDGYEVTAGNNVNWMLDASDVAAKYMRISWQRTSGTGGLSFAFCAKKQRG